MLSITTTLSERNLSDFRSRSKTTFIYCHFAFHISMTFCKILWTMPMQCGIISILSIHIQLLEISMFFFFVLEGIKCPYDIKCLFFKNTITWSIHVLLLHIWGIKCPHDIERFLSKTQLNFNESLTAWFDSCSVTIPKATNKVKDLCGYHLHKKKM